jgi:hypothetical protein
MLGLESLASVQSRFKRKTKAAGSGTYQRIGRI